MVQDLLDQGLKGGEGGVGRRHQGDGLEGSVTLFQQLKGSKFIPISPDQHLLLQQTGKKKKKTNSDL